MELDDRELERLKKLVPYKVLAPTSDEICDEIERLNNIIKRLEEDLREMYLTFGEFSEEYTENKIKELKGENNEEN